MLKSQNENSIIAYIANFSRVNGLKKGMERGMKKKAAIIFSVILLIGLAAGCGNKLDVEESTVYVDKKGSVISVDVESFEKDYYDEAELKSYIEEEIENYTSENGKKSVHLEDVAVEDSTATLKLKYASAEDYAKFNGIELYTGTVVKAMAEGYDFNVDFAAVKDGAVTGSVTKDEVIGNDDYKVAIIKANTDVVVDGTIVYVSSENVSVTGENAVSIREGYQALESLGAGAESVSGTESVSGEEATESIEGTEMTEQTAAQDEFAYETDVYTYIIFK